MTRWDPKNPHIFDFSKVEMVKCDHCGFEVKESAHLGVHEGSLHCKARIESREQTALGRRATLVDRLLYLQEAGIPYQVGHSVRRRRALVIEVLWVAATVELLCRIDDVNQLRWALAKWAGDEGFRQIVETLADVGRNIRKTREFLPQIRTMWKREKTEWLKARAVAPRKEAVTEKTPEQIEHYQQRDRLRVIARVLKLPTECNGEARTVDALQADIIDRINETQLVHNALVIAASDALNTYATAATSKLSEAMANLRSVLDEVIT